MKYSSVLEWFTAIGSMLTPVLLAVISFAGVRFTKRVEQAQQREADARERARTLEEGLREERLDIYNEILEPFIISFMKEETFQADRKFRGKTKEQAISQIVLSASYRQAAFRMSLFASDEVLRAFNGLMQFFFQSAESDISSDTRTTAKMLSLFGEFLLAVRRSVGSEKTELDNLEMLEWVLSDMDKLRNTLKEV